MALLILIIAPLLVGALSFFIRANKNVLYGMTLLASFFEFCATVVALLAVIQRGTYAWTAYFSVDALGVVVLSIVTLVGCLVSCYSVGYLQIEAAKGIIGFRRVRQYFVLLHLFLLAMFFAILTTHPVFMWIAIEATTLATAFLISFYNKPESIEAAWKYLIINSVGLLLAFFGTLLFMVPSVHSGFRGLVDWSTLLSGVSGFDPFLTKIAFLFILIGYGTKVGLVPMHTWLPDAHSKAPAPISSLLSGVLLNVAFLGVLRFKVIADAVIGAQFSGNLLLFFGILSIMVAAFIVLIQKSYKRLLAYSSIEHMGIIALGFGFGGAGAFAALLHMVYHSLTKATLFLSAGNMFLKYGSTEIKHVRGVLAALPVTSVLFIIGFLTITGVPPFGIFLTEFSIISAGIATHPFVIILALSGLALVFVGFLRHVSSMMFGERDPHIVAGEASAWTVVPIFVLVALLVIASVVIPSPIRQLLHSATIVY